MKKIQWRKWNRLIHRDLGYLCAGLTVVYAVSGLAVNHVRDWNPNYKTTEAVFNVGPVTAEIHLLAHLDRLGSAKELRW